MRGRLRALLRAGDGGSGASGSFETLYFGRWGGKIADAMLAEEECWRKLSLRVGCLLPRVPVTVSCLRVAFVFTPPFYPLKWRVGGRYSVLVFCPKAFTRERFL